MKGLIILGSVVITLLCSCGVKKPIQVETKVKSVSTTTATTNPYSADELINDEALKTAHVGIAIMDADKAEYLYQYQSNKYFVPASNTKIMTCYAAMKYLGDSLEGLRYEYDSVDGLIIKGTGDPTFLHPKFKQQSIFSFLNNHHPSNYLMNKNTYSFKPFGKGWTNDDYYEDYMNERSEFPIYGNDRNVSFKVDSSIQFYHYDQDKRKEYNGGYGLRSSVKVKVSTMDEASNGIPYFIRLLSDTLINPSLSVIYRMDKKLLPNILYSNPTDSVLRYMMFNSDNFFAEQLLLMVSNKQLGIMNDINLFDTLLSTDFKSFPQKPRWADACGLSRYNLFSPEDLVYTLKQIKQAFKEERINSIFPSGNQGTLKGYYSDMANYIHAKTGSMSGVLCLSGYITTLKNKHLIFSIMINNHQSKGDTLRRKIESYITELFNNN